MTIVADPDVNKNEKRKKKKTKKKKKLNLRALAAEKTRKESVSSDEIIIASVKGMVATFLYFLTFEFRFCNRKKSQKFQTWRPLPMRAYPIAWTNPSHPRHPRNPKNSRKLPRNLPMLESRPEFPRPRWSMHENRAEFRKESPSKSRKKNRPVAKLVEKPENELFFTITLYLRYFCASGLKVLPNRGIMTASFFLIKVDYFCRKKTVHTILYTTQP